MMDNLTIEHQQQGLMLSGEISIRTINARFEKKSLALLSKQIAKIDLAAVSKMDSAGLAWLLLMLEVAKQQAIALKITNIPQELVKLAKLSGVDSFLPVE